MKKIFLYLIATCAILSMGSCSLDDDSANFEFEYLEILEAEVPQSFDLNEVYEIKVTYLRPNDCTYFEGFDVIKEEETTRQVAVIGSTLTEQKDCAEIAQQVEATFDFKVIYTKDYLFKFYTGEDEEGNPQFIEIEVPVNQ